MKIPTIRGIIDRRVLVNYRIDPDVLARVCPAPFRPQVVNGFGVAGICLIRLKQIRPKFMPSCCGISSENAAHRIAVEWDADEATKNGGLRTGVFIPRRDTSSLLNSFAGGRIFPGVHHRARFDVREENDEYQITMNSRDGAAHVSVHGHATKELPDDSIWSSVENVSRFFESGSVGYSPASSPNQFDGLELQTQQWEVQPLAVSQVRSSFFNDRNRFPAGSVTFDHALLMRGIEHEWHSRDAICCTEG